MGPAPPAGHGADPPGASSPVRWRPGLLGALALTLVVFAGAPEHLITGSALLALAFGWTMLAVLSIHLTSQPQRWALVPAALMAVTGLGCWPSRRATVS